MTSRTLSLLLAVLAAAGCGTSPSDPIIPDPSGLISPADGAAVTGPDVDFTWDAISGATKYYHQVSASSTMQDPLETTVTGASATVTPGSPGTWWWRVRAAVSGQQTYTDWSSVWSFTMN
jgi:hypothetical protein